MAKALLPLAALTLVSACSSFQWAPTESWWRDGGRLCAMNRESTAADWDRATPRSCAQTLSETPKRLSYAPPSTSSG